MNHTSRCLGKDLWWQTSQRRTSLRFNFSMVYAKYVHNITPMSVELFRHGNENVAAQESNSSFLVELTSPVN